MVATTQQYDRVQLTKFTNPYTFAGRRFDPESGLYYYRARYYDAKLGRFLSRDPIGFEGSKWNLYEYVSGRPLIWTDPSGMGACENNLDSCMWAAGISYHLCKKRGGRFCEANYLFDQNFCTAKYVACKAEEGLDKCVEVVADAGEYVFDSLAAAGDWLADHPEVVIGAVVVVAGVTYVVATGGAGAPVLLAAAL